MKLRWNGLFAFLFIGFFAVVDGTGWSIEFEIQRVPGVLGHASYLTTDYSHQIVLDGEDIYVTYLLNDYKSSSAVVKYDGAEGKWSKPFILGGGEKYDQHYYPNMVMDHEGYLHVFYGSHCDPVHYRRTEEPRDISEWTEESFPIRIGTYPRPFVMNDGSLIVFMRSGMTKSTRYRYGFIRSTDGGSSWSEFKTLIDVPDNAWIPYVGGVYVEETADEDTVIHIAWSWFDYAKDSSNIYYEDVIYASFVPSKEIWMDAAGSEHPLPLTYDQVEPVWKKHWLYVEDLTLDPEGQPVVIFHDYDREGKAIVYTATFDEQWTLQKVYPGSKITTCSVRMANIDGNIVIVGSEKGEKPGLMLFTKAPGDADFTATQLTGEEHIPIHPGFAFDYENERMHIFWTETVDEVAGELYHAVLKK